jgi:hypothetical protein
MSFFDKLEKTDTFLIDYIFTPFAYWLHDDFGIRSKDLSRVSIVFTALAPLLERHMSINTLIINIAVCAFFLYLEITIQNTHTYRLGMVNPIRYLYLNNRITRLITSAIFIVILNPIEQLFWWGGIICMSYFSAVSDRPPTEKRVLVPITN